MKRPIHTAPHPGAPHAVDARSRMPGTASPPTDPSVPTRKILAGCLCLAVSVVAGFAADYTVKLEPGQGTILYLGTKQEFQQVRQDYFSEHHRTNAAPASADASKRLDFMPLGVNVADVYTFEPVLKKEGIGDAWKWYDRLLDVLKAGGVNTIYIQGGGAISSPNPLDKFAALVARHGIKLIIQTDDVFFHDARSFYPGSTLQKQFGTSENCYHQYLEPVVKAHLPKFRDNPDIFAWAPTEELDPSGEALFAEYKKLLHQLTPHVLLYQIDSQQCDLDRLHSKEPPYPDIFAFNRYCWQTADTGNSRPLWTPSFATRWHYGSIKPYADGVHKLFHRPCVTVLLGNANFMFFGPEDAKRWGWKAEPGFVDAVSGGFRWYEERKLWGGYTSYFPPPNSERLLVWNAICAGYKGVMTWGSVGWSPRKVQESIADPATHAGTETYIGMIRVNDLSTTPHWQDLCDGFREVKRFERVILALDQADTAYATAKDDGYTFFNSFVDDKGRHYVIVVNGRVAEWDGYNPEPFPTPQTKLRVDSDGNLTGYKALTEPRSISITVNGDQEVFDLRKDL